MDINNDPLSNPPFDQAATLFAAVYEETVLPPGFDFIEHAHGWALQDPEGVYTWTGTKARAQELAWTRFKLWTGCSKEAWCLRKIAGKVVAGQTIAMTIMQARMEKMAAQNIFDAMPTDVPVQ